MFKLAQRKMNLVSLASILEGYCQCESDHLSSLHRLNKSFNECVQDFNLKVVIMK